MSKIAYPAFKNDFSHGTDFDSKHNLNNDISNKFVCRYVGK